MPKLKSLGHRVAMVTLVRTQAPAENYGKGRGGRPWRRKRDRILKRDGYLCQPCKGMNMVTLATQVDHVTPQAEGGTEDDCNLQAICGPCHEAKSRAEAARGIRRLGGRS